MDKVILDVNANVVANNRTALSKVGASFGGQYFRVSQVLTDPKFAEKKIAAEANNDLDIILSRSPRRYKVGGFDIVSVEVGEDAEGASNVYINRGRKIQLGSKEVDTGVVIPITPDFRAAADVTTDAIKRSLKGDRSIIFAEPNKITEEANQLNEAEVRRLEALKTEIEAQIRMIKQTIDSNNTKAAKYLKERGAEETEVRVHIDEE